MDGWQTVRVNVTDTDNWVARKLRRAARAHYGWARVRVLGRFHYRVETPYGSGDIIIEQEMERPRPA